MNEDGKVLEGVVESAVQDGDEKTGADADVEKRFGIFAEAGSEARD